MDLITLPRPATMAAARPLAGKAAIVTGSTSGIGLGIARSLAAAGANVMLNGFGEATAIARLRDELESEHAVTVAHHSADMSRPDEIEGMVAAAATMLGGVDILVNNAGIQHVSPIEEFPPAKWDAILAINLSAVFHATRSVLPDMRRRGWGRIINVASAHGLIGSPFKSAYVAAKHGVVGLTKVTALETAEHGITCNAICPGYVWTPLVERQIASQAETHKLSPEQVVRDVFLKEQPTRKFATVAEIAGIAAFLCGSAAASITGTTIAADGGWTAH